MRIPTKRSLNLAQTGEKPIKWQIAIPAIILILACAFAIGKFAVADRFAKVNEAEGRASSMRSQVSAGYKKIEEFGELTDRYAHYTYSGMTDEEVHLAERTDVLVLISKRVLPYMQINSWQLSGNTLTLNVTGSTLRQITDVATGIEEDELVDFCTVSTAATTDTVTGGIQPADSGTDTVNEVQAKIVVYLNESTEVQG